MTDKYKDLSREEIIEISIFNGEEYSKYYRLYRLALTFIDYMEHNPHIKGGKEQFFKFMEVYDPTPKEYKSYPVQGSLKLTESDEGYKATWKEVYKFDDEETQLRDLYERKVMGLSEFD